MFKSKEEKEQLKQQKENEKVERFLDSYGLQDISPEYYSSIKRIATDLTGAGFGELGSIGGNTQVNTLIRYCHAIVEQQFVIIEELDALNKKLNK